MADAHPKTTLRKLMDLYPLPALSASVIEDAAASLGSDSGAAATEQAQAVVTALNAALVAGDAKAVQDCFFPGQAYFRDHLALTYTFRNFISAGVASAALVETTKLREAEGFKVEGSAAFVPATPALQFINAFLTFRTKSPAATCSGRLVLLPSKTEDGKVAWKIWVLSTKLDDLDQFSEDIEGRLKAPARDFSGSKTIETDVFIVGGGNSGVCLGGRLKAFGVDYLIVDKNPQPGDNWALRYDCLTFHLPTSFCEMPYINYDKELQYPHLLTRLDLAAQVRRFVETFHLNTMYSVHILSTEFDKKTDRWTITFETPSGLHTAVAKQLVMATGVGSQVPYMPPEMAVSRDLYKGTALHSAEFSSGKALKEENDAIKTVAVIGSANTAFDVLADCHAAGLETTMVVRSPTYVTPLEYVCEPRSLGLYNEGDGGIGVEMADRMMLSMPKMIDGQFLKGLFGMLAAAEPDRYKALEAAGFPLLTDSHPDTCLLENLLEHAGGHYVDVGCTSLIADKKVGLRALVQPTAYTATGLQMSDGSTLEADAVVWCTGFADKDVRQVTAQALGGNGRTESTADSILTAQDVAGLLEPTWGLDDEGEIRGLWRRMPRIDRFSIMGGYTQKHRYFSRMLALQIAADLDGLLPAAYQKTPAASAQV